MKKLHKKIGAVALAGMIIAGGVGASKIESHALWWRKPSSVIYQGNWHLDKLSKGAQIGLDYILDYIKHNKGDRQISILAASDNEYDLNEYINKEYTGQPQVKRKLLSNKIPDCFYGRHFMAVLNSEKNVGNDIAKVKFGDVYVIASIK